MGAIVTTTSRQRAALYVGGTLGPYAGTMVTPIVHEVGADLAATPGAVAGSVTAYMVPFAALMLVSGTLAERWGRERTMRWSLVAFAVASAACAAVPDLGWLFAARALQGCANAFTTPLLLAAITDLVPRERLGRALGLFAGMQAAGQAASPLVSGVAAALDWRLAFAAPTAIAVVLALTVPRMGAPDDRPRGGWRALASGRLALACAVAFLCYLAAVAVTVLGVLRAEDDFGLGPVARGLLGTAFGVAGLVAGPLLGRRSGPVLPVAVVLATALAASLVLTGLAGSIALLVAGIAVTGAAVTGVRAIVNGLATTSAPDNRAGAASVCLALQFFGGALAPVLGVPLYGAVGGAALAAVALAPLAAAVLLLAGRRVAVTGGRAGGSGGYARVVPPDLGPLLDDVERLAPALDRGDDDVRTTLRRLAGHGLLDLAAGPDRVAELPRVVDLVEGLAARCLPTAFSLWSHRMVIDYLAHTDPSSGLDAGALVRGERWGSTGLAPALRDVVGLGAVPLTARRDGAGVRVDGPVRWASNLFPATLLVVPVRLPDEGDDARAVVALSIDAPGVTVHAHPRLLAMNATASSALTLADAPAAVLGEDLGAFVAALRPRLLLVQSAFCLGLAGRSVGEAGAGLSGDAAAFGGEVDAVGERVDDARGRLARGAAGPGDVAVPDLLRLRLDAARLAGDATRLEAAVAGGAGYVADSGTARRQREAAFLPVQAPTEALLRLCLRHS